MNHYSQRKYNVTNSSVTDKPLKMCSGSLGVLSLYNIMEEFRKIKDFEMYEISNLGNLRRLYSYGYKYIKPSIKGNTYPQYTLSLDGKLKTFKVHILVAKCFLNYIPNKGVIVVDHIDNNKLNYNLNNLQIISMRENLIKDNKRESKYPNVYKNRKKWRARINYNNYNYCLGTFETQEMANNKIIEFLEKMEGGNKNG